MARIFCWLIFIPSRSCNELSRQAHIHKHPYTIYCIHDGGRRCGTMEKEKGFPLNEMIMMLVCVCLCVCVGHCCVCVSEKATGISKSMSQKEGRADWRSKMMLEALLTGGTSKGEKKRRMGAMNRLHSQCWFDSLVDVWVPIILHRFGSSSTLHIFLYIRFC